MEKITSTQNPKFKNLGKLREKKHRDETNSFLVEGEKEISLALKNGFICLELWGTEEKLAVFRENVAKFIISNEMFEKIGYREKTETIIGVFKKKGIEIKLRDAKCVLVCEDIEKPGNIGALFRIADGAGVDAIVFNEQQTDIYNPNVIRNSVGTFFSVPFVTLSSEETYKQLKESGIKVIVATPEASTVYHQENLAEKLALVVGSEHEGVSSFWKKKADINVSVPMLGQNDSLNLSVSVAVILYERLRQLA
jgi:TrmH family RNA methyltransferase